MATISQFSSFRNVLVGVDGRQGGRDAIALARLLVAADGQLLLAHVYPGEEHPSRGSSPSYDVAMHDDSLRLLTDEQIRAALADGTVAIAASSVAHGLHRLVAERNADLLVVGSSRRGIIGSLTLGDDTRDSLRHANCVAAIAPAGYAENTDSMRAIGVGYDDSEESKAALALARRIAEQRDAKLRVMTVVTPPRVGYGAPLAIESVEDAARERLEALEADGEVVFGIPARELASFGGEVDLLVVGSHGHGPLGRFFLGSTSEHLARVARCPMIVVPHAVVGQPVEQEESSVGASS